MPRVIVAGGGLAGLAATVALADAGFQVRLFESRAFLGGRASSFPLTGSDERAEVIDNCQHVLLRCCVNLLDFYRRLGVENKIRFHRDVCFLEPGGRLSRLRSGWLPAPLHFAGSFCGARFLGLADKLAVARGIRAVRRDYGRRPDLDSITMLDWLTEQRQTTRAIERFWRQVLVSAVNEELDRMAARHGLQVFHLGFLAHRDAYQIGVPAVPLSEMYSAEIWRRWPNVEIRPRTPVDRLLVEPGRAVRVLARGEEFSADAVVCALPFERVTAFAPDLGLPFDGWEHSPITGIHLWFDRAVTDLPQAALLDRTIQWFFNKSAGRYLQVVVSASRSLLELSRGDVIDLAVRELAEFLPAVKPARVEKAHVIKEVRATMSARPGLERPPARTRIDGLYLAGDWTATGWPATMEGAVRSGYLAAEAIAADGGAPRRFLLPDPE